MSGELPQLDGVVHVDDIDTFMGYSVNDFTSSVHYAIFNDPDTFGPVEYTEPMRELLFDTPLVEDDDLDYVTRHSQLMNADRAASRNAQRVVVKEKMILETSWQVRPT